MTPLQTLLDQIQTKAEGATPGPWMTGNWLGQCKKKHQHAGERGPDPCVYEYRLAPDKNCVVALDNITLVSYDDWGPVLNEFNAAHIAQMNPQTTLTLVAIIKRAVATLKCECYCLEPMIPPCDNCVALDEINRLVEGLK